MKLTREEEELAIRIRNALGIPVGCNSQARVVMVNQKSILIVVKAL